MTPEEITDRNRLIAEFMGYTVKVISDTSSGGGIHTYNLYIKDGKKTSDCYYHSSWDWLIPVVEKIETIDDPYHGYFGVYISSNACTVQATNFRPDLRIPDPPHYFATYVENTKIEATFHAVTDWIKWYTKLTV